MIRFACSNCGREYHLPDALAHLPLLCKGCGQRLTVPDPTPDSDPEPFPEPPLHPPTTAGTIDLFPDTDELRKGAPARDVPDPQDTVDLFPQPTAEPSPTGSLAKSAPPSKRQPATEAVSPVPAGRGRALGVAADVAAGVLLAGVGMLLGEFATGRGTGEILREAGGAPKFPPVDLLLWVACVATPVLGYVLFANRGKSVGGWLRRRAER